MAKAHYSTVFEQPARDIWKIVRNFNNYPVWVGGAGESEIVDGKSGATVGAVRNVLYQGRRIRQRLLAQSDVERSQTYEFCGAATLPMTDYQATANYRHHLQRPRLCRMVGDIRLRFGPPRRIDQKLAGFVREMARIAPRYPGKLIPGSRCRGRTADWARFGVVFGPIPPLFVKKVALFGWLVMVFGRVRTVAFTACIWHSSAVAGERSPTSRMRV